MAEFKLNNNGNTPQQIKEELLAVHHAANNLRDAMAKMELFHGRNYQTCTDPELSRRVDLTEYEKHLKAVADVVNWSMDLSIEVARNL